MLETFKQLITDQYEAALRTLNACMTSGPPSAWEMPIARYKLGQVVFHTLFFADYYLGQNADALREQPFHREHADTFADYEELQYREPVILHDRAFVEKYFQHVRSKAKRVLAAESDRSLTAKADFARRDFSRAELHVYNIRHIQHHAAQLILRLRVEHQQDFPWFGSAWPNA